MVHDDDSSRAGRANVTLGLVERLCFVFELCHLLLEVSMEKKKEEANCHLTHEYISKVYEIKVLKMNKRRENAWFCFLYVVERGVFVGT